MNRTENRNIDKYKKRQHKKEKSCFFFRREDRCQSMNRKINENIIKKTGHGTILA